MEQRDQQESVRGLTDRVDKEIEADIRKLKRTSWVLAAMGTVVVLLIVVLLIYTLDRRDEFNVENPMMVLLPSTICYASPDERSKELDIFSAGDELIARDYDQGWYLVSRIDADGKPQNVQGWVRDDAVITNDLRVQQIKQIQSMATPVKIVDERTACDHINGKMCYSLEGQFLNMTAAPLNNVRLEIIFNQKHQAPEQNEGPLTLPTDVTESGRETGMVGTVERTTETERAIPTLTTREQLYFTDTALPADTAQPFNFSTEISIDDAEFRRWYVSVGDYPVKLSYTEQELTYDDTGYFKLHYTLSNRTDVPLSNIKVTVVFEDTQTSTLYTKTQTVCTNTPLKKGVDRSFDFEGLVERADNEQLAEEPLTWRGARVRAEPIEIYNPVWKTDEIGNYTLFAALRNNTTLPVQYVKVKVNFFDQNRELVDYKYSTFAVNKPLVFGEPQEIAFRGTFTRNYRYKMLSVESFK